MNNDNIFFRQIHYKLALGILGILSLVLAMLIGSLNWYLYFVNEQHSNFFISEAIRSEGFQKDIVEVDNTHISGASGSFDDSFSFFEISKEKMYGNITSAFLLALAGDSIGNLYNTSVEKARYQNYLACKIDIKGDVIEMIHDFSSSLEDFDEVSAILNVLSRNSSHGSFDNYSYGIKAEPYGYFVVFLDRTSDLELETRLSKASTIIFLISLIFAFFITLLISLWSLKPVNEAYSKQKQFIADASHELKTPIAVINTNLDVLSQEYPDNKWISYIRDENLRMGTLVKDMLFLAQNDAGKINAVRTSFDVCHLVSFSVLPLECMIFEAHKTLEINVPDKEIFIEGYEAELKRAIIILLDNAIKHTPEGGKIRVSVEEVRNHVYIKVYNTGRGIPPEEIDKIFLRFYRADTSRSRETGGYGLGLAIAKAIVENHKGKISVESCYMKDAEFIISIPLENNESFLHRFYH